MTDERNGMHEDAGAAMPGPADDDLLTPADIAEVMRLDAALLCIEAGEDVDLDPREDPALVGMIATAADLRHAMEDATDTRAFQSFHQRSRAALIHQLELDRAPATIIRWRRGRLLTGLGAAAASIALFGFTLGGGTLPLGGGTQEVGPNLTAMRSESELARLAQALDDIQLRASQGQSVPAPLLHSVVENAASMANAIESNPTRFDRNDVAAFAQTAQESAAILSSVTPEDGAEGALTAAQRAARDGVVVATRFLDGNETPTPEPTVTETPTDPTATPTETPDPDVTGTPSDGATPIPTPTPGVSPEEPTR